MTRLLCTMFLLVPIVAAGTIDYTATTNQCTSFSSCSDWQAYSINSTIAVSYVSDIKGWTAQPVVNGSIAVKVEIGDGSFKDFQAPFSGSWTIVVGGTTSYPTYTGTLAGTFSYGGISGTFKHTIYNHAVKMGRGPMIRQSLDFGGTIDINY